MIREVLGYRINNHNLSILLLISQMFTMDLAALFNLQDADSAALFEQLKHAYVDVRYKDLYEPDEKAVHSIYQTVKGWLVLLRALSKAFKDKQPGLHSSLAACGKRLITGEI